MPIEQNTSLKDKAYVYVYNNIIQHHLYSKAFFSNIDEFKEFCKRDFKDVSTSALNKLILSPEIEIKKSIIENFQDYYLTHNNLGKGNDNISFFKVIYTRKVSE